MTASTEGARSAPDRRLMWSVGLTVFIVTVASFVRAPLLPDIGTEFSLGATQLGVLTAVFALGRLVADLPAGRLTDELSARTMLVTAAVIVSGSSLLFAGASTTAMIFGAALLGGVGSAWTNTTGLAFFASLPDRRGVSVSFFATALLAGQAFGPAFGGAVESAADWRVSFLAAAALAGLGLTLAFARPAPRNVRTSSPMRSDATGSIPGRVTAVLFALPALQFAIGGALTQTLFPIIGEAELGLTAGAIGLGLAIGGISRVVGALTAGQVSDRVGRRWALISGLAVQVVGIVLAALHPTFASWLGAIVLSSLGSVGVGVGATMLGDLTASGDLGRRIGGFRFAGDLGFVLGPLAAGLIYDTVGRAAAVLPIAVAAIGVTVAVGLFLPETRLSGGPGPVLEEDLI